MNGTADEEGTGYMVVQASSPWYSHTILLGLVFALAWSSILLIRNCLTQVFLSFHSRKARVLKEVMVWVRIKQAISTGKDKLTTDASVPFPARL